MLDKNVGWRRHFGSLLGTVDGGYLKLVTFYCLKVEMCVCVKAKVNVILY